MIIDIKLGMIILFSAKGCFYTLYIGTARLKIDY